MTTKEMVKLVKWARDNGATQIELEGVKLHFDGHGEPTEPEPAPMPQSPAKASLPRSLFGYTEEATRGHSVDNSRSDETSGLKSEEDDPDAYARMSDMWANCKPLPRR